MPCDRRTVLSALAGGGLAASVGASPGTASTPSDATGTETPTDAFGQVRREGTPATLEGSVTTAPVSADGRLLVGTDRGLYVFEEAALAAFVPTRPVRTIEPVDGDRAVVLVADPFFPNVLAVDIARGEIDWTAARSRSVFSQEFGRIDRQVPVFDAVGVGSVVAVATGYGVVAFDRETGEQRWTVDRDFYSWQLATRDGEVYATTQDGKLLAIDGATGEQRYAVGLADPFESPNGPIPRSAWAIAAVESGPGDLVVTTEDGYVHLVSSRDGSVEWKRRVFEPDSDDLESYYRRIGWRPTMAGGANRSADANFFNLELTVVDDGPPRFAVTIHERGPGRPDQNPGQVALVTATGELTWTNESIDLGGAGNVRFSETIDPDSLLVPSPPDGDTQTVEKLALADGQAEDALSVPAAPSDTRGPSSEGHGYLAIHDGDLVVASESGDLIVLDGEREIRWSFPAVRDGEVLKADFTGDGADDYLVYSRNRLDRRRGVESRTLVVRSGTDGSIVWSRTPGADQFRAEGGLQSLQRIDSDDGTDLMAIEKPPDLGNDNRIRNIEREIEDLDRQIRELERKQRNSGVDNTAEIRSKEDRIQSRLAELDELGGRPIADLVVLSGEDGSERARISLTVESRGTLDNRIEPVSINTLDDDDNMVFIGGNNGVAFANIAFGEVTEFWQYRPDEGDLWPPFDSSHRIKYVSVGGPGDYEDMVAIAADEPASFAVIETGSDGEYITFEKTATFELNDERIDPGSIRTLSDLNGDGYDELLCLVEKEDTQALIVVSPGDGEVIGRYESADSVAPTVRETTTSGGGDGLVTFTSDGDRFTVSVTDGIEEVWSRQEDLSRRGSFGQEYRPADRVGEVAGSEAVAVATTAHEGGAKVDLYDLSSGDRVNTVVLEPFDDGVDPAADPLAPATLVQRLPAPGGGAPNLGVIADPTGEGDTRLYVVDPREGEVLVSGDADDGTFVDRGDVAGLLGRDGGLRTVDVTAGVTLDAQGGPTVDFSWAFDDDVQRVSTLSVGDRPVAVTTDRSTDVRLPPGEHTAELRATSPDGFTVYDSTTVSVTGGSSMDLLLYSAAGASVLALFGSQIVEGVRRRVRS